MPKTMRWRVSKASRPGAHPFGFAVCISRRSIGRAVSTGSPGRTTSISEARGFGETKVDIHYFDYFPRSQNTDRDTNPQLVEARYVQR